MKFFKKTNGQWEEVTESSFADYAPLHAFEYGGDYRQEGPVVVDEAYVPTGSHDANLDVIYNGTTGKPNVKTDENGNVTNYELTETGENGINGQEFNTGIVALNGGGGFRVHAVFDLTVSEQSTYDYIFGAYESVGNNKYAGLGLTTYGQYQVVTLYASKSGQSPNGGAIGYSISNSRLVVPRTRQRYTLEFEYTPSSSDQGGTVSLSISPSSTGSGNSVVDTPATFTTTNSYIPNSLDNAMLVLGGNGVTDKKVENMTVYEFSVEKL